MSVKSSQNRLYRREEISLACSVMIKEATRDKTGFLEHSKPSRGGGGGDSRKFSRAMCRFHRNPRTLPHQSLLLWEAKLVWKTIDTDITL